MFDISKLTPDAIQVILNAAAILNEESVKVEEAKPEPEEKLPFMTAQEFTDFMEIDTNYYDGILKQVRPDMTDEYPEFYKGAVLLSKWIINPTSAVVNEDEDIWRGCITRINRLAAQVDCWVSGQGFDRNMLDAFTIDEIKNIGDDEKVIYNRYGGAASSYKDDNKHIACGVAYKKLSAIVDTVSETIWDDEFEIRFAGTPVYAEVQTIGRMIASVLGVSSLKNDTLCKQKISELCNGFESEFSVHTNPVYITITTLGDRIKCIFDLETNAETEEKFEAANACYFDDMYEAAGDIEERKDEPEGEIRFPDRNTTNEACNDASETDDYGNDETPTEVQTSADPEASSPESEVVATQVIPVVEAEEVKEPAAPAGGSSVTNAQMDELVLRTCQSYLKTVSKIVSQGKAGDTEQLIVVSCMRSYCSSKNIQAISSYYPTFAATYNQIAAIVNAGYIPATFDELVTALK